MHDTHATVRSTRNNNKTYTSIHEKHKSRKGKMEHNFCRSCSICSVFIKWGMENCTNHTKPKKIAKDLSKQKSADHKKNTNKATKSEMVNKNRNCKQDQISRKGHDKTCSF